MNASLSPADPAPATAPATALNRAPPEGVRRHVGALLGSYRPGLALPGAFFSDETLFEAEMQYLFGRHWLFVASEPEIPEGGDYRTLQIGPVADLHPAARRRLDRRLPQHLPPPRLAHPAAGRRASPAQRSSARTIAGRTTCTAG